MTALDAVGLLGALTTAGIRFVVVGGFAVIAHGVVRGTKDLDICPDPAQANLARLAALLDDLDAQPAELGEFAPEEMPFDARRPDELAAGGNFRLTTRLGLLDVMQWIAGLPEDDAYRALAADAVEADVDGTRVLVASLERVRAMKQAAGRPGDLEDLRRLDLANPGT